MGNWVSQWIEQMTYFGVALLMFLENVFPPIPSELILPLSGFSAKQGHMTLWGVIIAATIGSILGQLPLYYLGRYLGEGHLKNWLGRHPWAAITPDELDRAIKWFDHYGSTAVFFCRLVPGLRSLISIPAGICEMSLSRFLTYTSAGTVLWSALLSWLGWLLGENHKVVAKYIDPISAAILIGIAVLYLYRVFHRMRTLRAQRETER